MSAYQSSEEELFQAPPQKPKFRLWRHQMIGIPLLLLIPILALLGVFGKKNEKLILSEGSLEASIQYPSKLRYGQEEWIRIEIKNSSDLEVSDISVAVDKDYVKDFDEVTFQPEASQNYKIQSLNIPPHSSAHVDVKVRAGDYGSSKGKIEIANKTGSLMSGEIETFTFP